MSSLDDNALDAMRREAVAIWPRVHVTLERFREVLEQAVAASGGSLDAVHASDLYLVAGCLASQSAALAFLEHDVMAAVRASVERACGREGSPEDTIQITLTKLLVGPPSPKLAQYTGRGPLIGWVRVVAVREALQARRRNKGEGFADAGLIAELGEASATIEMKVLRNMHEPSFKLAVQGAIRRLTAEQRALLRFNVRDGLTIDQLAPMLGIHRATVARRLEKARSDALAHTQAILREQHGLSESEARSLCLALGADVDLSIVRALSDEGP